MASVRAVTADDLADPRPVYAVWEVTLKCDHACGHCGSRAGAARADELDTAALLDVAAQLVRLRSREVTLIGGEAYLRPDLAELTAFLVARGVRVTMQTGGLAFTEARARALKEAGLAAVGVSVDGPPAEHDRLRGRPGSHAAAMRALAAARATGLPATVNTQVNRLNAHLLPETCRAVRDAGAVVWRPQLTVPMGRAADHPDWILEPWRIVEVVDTLARLQAEAMHDARARGVPLDRAFHLIAGNNVGYYGPHEETIRSRPGTGSSYWQGCIAGRFTLGIESDGTVKGCPSLPTAPYTGGNVRDVDLATLWESAEAIAFTRTRTTDELWGFCAGCYYAHECRAGCSFTAHATMGRRGNMPFCYHRASTLAARGRRERLVPVERAAGEPYDFGRFEIVEEDL